MNSSSASAPSNSSTPSSANSRKSKGANTPGATTDAAWEHAIDLGQRKVKCKFCSCEFTGDIYRFKHHLARTHKDASACLMVPEDIKVKFQKVVEQMELAASKKRRPFSVDEEEELLESDDRHNVQILFFSKKQKVQSTLNKIYKKDERDKACQQIARFFYTSALSFNCVKNPKFKKMIQMVGDFGRGLDPPSYHEMRVTYFKKEVDYKKALLEDYKKEWKKTASIDTFEISKTKEKVFAMLDDFVEKIGEEHIVQVMTDNAANYKAAGEMEFTKGKELLRPGATRFATFYLTLGRLHEQKGALISMFASEKWTSSNFSKLEIGKNIESIVLDTSGFWGSVSTCLLAAIPLIKVLQMVDSDSSPVMGFIYHAMKKAKEDIKSNCKSVQSRYEPIINIIDARWDNQLNRPLHVAGYFLNPMMQYSPDFKGDISSLKLNLYMCIEKMCGSGELADEIDCQLDMFKNKKGEQKKMKETAAAIEQLEALDFEDVESDDEWITKEESTQYQAHDGGGDNVFLESVLEANLVLRMVDSDSTPAMGFIYHDMKKAKEEIKSNYKSVQSRYEPIINIIDARWDNQLNRPLHVAGYFLNPRMQYSPDFKGDIPSLKLNLYLCIEKMCVQQGTILIKKTPVDWWDSFGDDTPELKRFAMRVLSLTCSSSGCERNGSAFEMVHSKRRNCLHQQKMNDLVYVMYNLKLTGKEQKKMKEAVAAIEQLEDLDFEDVESDDEWITEEESTQSQAHDGGGDNVFLESAIRSQFGGVDDEFEEPNFNLHEENDMDSDAAHMIVALKVPMLKPEEFDLWRMRIEQYIQMMDYALWGVIKNENSILKTQQSIMLRLSYLLQLQKKIYKEGMRSKQEKRFSGNDATKKTQRNHLKQQYENFSGSSSKSLDQTFDKLQKLVNQLELLSEVISQEDINKKFLRSFPSEWDMHVGVITANGVNTASFQ
nr:hypothetical protein [Tanacetum cinerariifolium]